MSGSSHGPNMINFCSVVFLGSRISASSSVSELINDASCGSFKVTRSMHDGGETVEKVVASSKHNDNGLW